MSSRGYILIEVLVATMLFSLAGTGLYSGLSQGLKANERIRQSFRQYDPFRTAFLRLEKDLRNMVDLRDYPFVGKKEEIEFPARRSNEVLQIRYTVKRGELIRSEQALNNKLAKEKAKKRVLLKDLKEISFTFAYFDEEDRLVFEPFWVDDPYLGIPRAVKITTESKNGLKLSKLVSIPQGRWGRLAEHE